MYFSESTTTVYGAVFPSIGKGKNGVFSCASALRFVAGMLGMLAWSVGLSSPVVVAWCNEQAYRRARKEALPFPLVIMAMFEEAVFEDMRLGVFGPDTALLTGFLTMLWGALRFSDLQRVRVPDLEIGQGVVRGKCWRIKSAGDGMPFGFLAAGIRGDWGSAVVILKSHLVASDFVFQALQGGRASFLFVLCNLRRLLMEKGHAPEKHPWNYSMYSLTVAGLSWALQIDVDPSSRRPALRAQLKVLRSIRAGWCPLTPQACGGKEPLKEVNITSAVAAPLVIRAGLGPPAIQGE